MTTIYEIMAHKLGLPENCAFLDDDPVRDHFITRLTRNEERWKFLQDTNTRGTLWYREDSLAVSHGMRCGRPKLEKERSAHCVNRVTYWSWDRYVFSFRKGAFHTYQVEDHRWENLGTKGWQKVPRKLSTVDYQLAMAEASILHWDTYKVVPESHYLEQLAQRAEAIGLYVPKTDKLYPMLLGLTFPASSGLVDQDLCPWNCIHMPKWLMKPAKQKSMREWCGQLFGVAGKQVVKGFEAQMLARPDQLGSLPILFAHLLKDYVPQDWLPQILAWDDLKGEGNLVQSLLGDEGLSGWQQWLFDLLQTYSPQRVMTLLQDMLAGGQAGYSMFQDTMRYVPRTQWVAHSDYGASFVLPGYFTERRVKSSIRKAQRNQEEMYQLQEGEATQWSQPTRERQNPGYEQRFPTRPRSVEELHDDLVRQHNVWERDNRARQLAQASKREQAEAQFHYVEKVEQTLQGHQIGRFTVGLPQGRLELVDWGNALSICIGSYWHKAHYGTALLLGLFEEGKDMPTYCLEISREHHLAQFKGVRNSRALPEDFELVVEELIRLGVVVSMSQWDIPDGVPVDLAHGVYPERLWTDCPTQNHYDPEEDDEGIWQHQPRPQAPQVFEPYQPQAPLQAQLIAPVAYDDPFAM